MTTLFDESRYDVFSPEQHRERSTGVSVAEAQLQRARWYVERLETELADPRLSERDRANKQATLDAWRPFLRELLAETAQQEAAE